MQVFHQSKIGNKPDRLTWREYPLDSPKILWTEWNNRALEKFALGLRSGSSCGNHFQFPGM